MSRPDLRRIVPACVVLLLAASAAAPASAQITFTNRALWQAAVGSHVTIDFEGIAPDGGLTQFPGGLTVSGVTFRGANLPATTGLHALAVFDSGSATYISAWNSGDMAVAGAGFGTAGSPPGSITLPGGVAAVGFNYAVTCAVTLTPACGSLPWTVRLSTGAVITIPGNGPPPTMAFWGIVSPVPITSLQIDPSASLTLLDDFSFQAPAVPSLSWWAMLALTGLLTLAGVASIRRRGWNSGR